MKQILHIFAKDTRRFWPEILLSLAITAAFAIVYPRQWWSSPPNESTVGFVVVEELRLLSSCLVVLVPISWWFLIGRVIHAESLVGDRQFWLTRPYEWKKLLAAKALFLAVYLYLPFFIAQCFLLAAAGFSPLSYLPGLLFNLLLVSGILVLPLVSLATVTSTFVRMALTIVGILLAIIVLGVLSSSFGEPSASIPLADHLSIPLIICGTCVIIALQYATRRVWLSRLLIAVIALLLILVPALRSDDARMERAYPRGNSPESSIRLAFADQPLHHPVAMPAQRQANVSITLPLRISGIAAGYVWTPDNVKVAFEGPPGDAWQSSWQPVYQIRLLPGTQDFNVSFQMSRAYFNRVHASPVTLQLTFAFTQLQAGEVRHIPLPADTFAIPRFGVCSLHTSATVPPQVIGIDCRSALRQPALTYVETLWTDDACPANTAPLTTGVAGAGWAGTLDNEPAQFGITSVWDTPVPLTDNWRPAAPDGSRPELRHLCPGTPLTLTSYHVARRGQTTLTLADFHLPAYTTNAGSTNTVITVGR